MHTQVFHLFDSITSTLTYIVYNNKKKQCIIIDPVLNYESSSSIISYESINKIIDFIQKNELHVNYIFETHIHADHITGAYELKKFFPQAKTAIHKNVNMIQQYFGNIFNISYDHDCFDILFDENSTFSIDGFDINIIELPGHTPACSGIIINNMIFTGDTIFMPDFGSARCDFPFGSAEKLYDSIVNKLYKLPEDMNIYVGHDYQPNGRPLAFTTTIKACKQHNIHINENTIKEDFIHFRNNKDKTLSSPKLLLPSLQLNIQNGKLPKTESNDTAYLKIPLIINHLQSDFSPH